MSEALELPERSAAKWCVVLIVVVVLVTFAPLLRCQFTDWDDPDTIWANPHLHPATLANIAHYWTHAEGELYIPLTYSIWGALAHLGQAQEPNGTIGPSAAVYHGANVAVHAMAAVVAFWILRRLIRNDWAACAVALVFALHLVQTELVAWASGMKDLLAGLFVLIALWQYVAWIEHRRRWQYALVLLAMTLGMLCKPTAVVTPLLALVIDVSLIGRSPRAAMRSLWPMFVLAIPCVLWTRAAQPPSLGAHVPLWQRPIVACDALAFYLWKLIWPNRLGMDYGRAPRLTLSQGSIWITWGVPATLAAMLWFLRNRARPVGAGALIAVG